VVIVKLVRVLTTVDDFETGTAAAAAGGTTTIVDFAEQTPGTTLAQALETWKDRAASRSILDYGFHLALSEVTESVLNEIPAMVDAGVTSFHVRLDGINERHITDSQLFEFLQCVFQVPAVLVVPRERKLCACLSVC